jgi:hypothetical protein
VEGCFGSGKRKYSLRFDNTSAGQRCRDFNLRLAKMDTQLREAQEELEHSFLKACASDQLAQAQLEQLQRAQSLMVRLTPRRPSRRPLTPGARGGNVARVACRDAKSQLANPEAP